MSPLKKTIKNTSTSFEGIRLEHKQNGTHSSLPQVRLTRSLCYYLQDSLLAQIAKDIMQRECTPFSVTRSS